MVETTGIKKIGNSLGVYLDKSVLEKVYHVGEGDKVEIDYRFSEICIKMLPVDSKAPAEVPS